MFIRALFRILLLPILLSPAFAPAATLNWSAPVRIASDIDIQNLNSRQLVIDDSGNALYLVSGSGGIKALRYDATDAAWDALHTVSETGLSSWDGPAPQVIPDSLGNFTVVWVAPNSYGQGIIRSARYDAVRNTWSIAQDIRELAIRYIRMKFSVDDVGNVLLVWDDYNDTDSGFRFLQSARYDIAEQAWGNVQSISGTEDVYEIVKIVGGDSGSAMLVWIAFSNGGMAARGARYDATTDVWDTVQEFSGREGVDLGGYSSPGISVVADESGHVMAVWVAPIEDGAKIIRGSRYDVLSRNWAEIQDISNNNRIADFPQAAADAVGNITVVWDSHHYDQSGTSIATFNSSRFDAETGAWSAVREVSNNSSLRWQIDRKLFVDPAGNATMVWYPETGGYSYPPPDNIIRSASYDITTDTWGNVETINDSDEDINFFVHQLEADEAGNVVFVWSSKWTPYAAGSDLKSLRYDSTIGEWSAVRGISVPIPSESDPRFAYDSAGNAIVFWTDGYFTPTRYVSEIYSAYAHAVAECTESARSLTRAITSDAAQYSSEQSITVEGTASVNVGAQLTLRAPRIIFEPGFRVASGAQLSAVATSVQCAASAAAAAALETAIRSQQILSAQPPGAPAVISATQDLPEWITAQFASFGVDLRQIASSLLDDDEHWLIIETTQALQSSDHNATSDLYRLDLLSDQISLVSVTPCGRAGNAASRYAAVDASGELIVFQSEATDLVLGDDNQVSDIFMRDLALKQTTRLSQGEQASAHPALDAAGETLLYDQARTQGKRQVFGQALSAGAVTELLSISTDDRGLQVDNHHPAISADGRYVAYLEEIDIEEVTGCQIHIFDRDTGVYHRQACPDPLARASETVRPSFSPEADVLYWHLPGQAEPVMLTNPLSEARAVAP